MTRREEITTLLEKEPLSAHELALRFEALPQDIVEDLEHIKKSIKPKKLVVIPAKCEDCGFVFKEREKIKKPSKCPKCRGERIFAPLFKIK